MLRVAFLLMLATLSGCPDPVVVYIGEDPRDLTPGDVIEPPQDAGTNDLPTIDLAADPDALAGAIAIEGHLLVDDTGLQTISALSLVSIEGDLIVRNNDSLTLLSLPALLSIGRDLRIENNPVLSTVSLPALLDIEGEVVIDNNPALSFLALDGLLNIAGPMTLQSRLPTGLTFPALQTVGGLIVGGAVALENPELVTLNFGALTVVEGPLTVERNADLTTLATPFLGRVEGDVVIRENAQLTSWQAGNLVAIEGGACVCDNGQLPTCAVADTLAGVDLEGPQDIGGNDAEAVCD